MSFIIQYQQGNNYAAQLATNNNQSDMTNDDDLDLVMRIIGEQNVRSNEIVGTGNGNWPIVNIHSASNPQNVSIFVSLLIPLVCFHVLIALYFALSKIVVYSEFYNNQ